jgi:hypothetical protein
MGSRGRGKDRTLARVGVAARFSPLADISGTGIGGTPAIPRIEFNSARFSARSSMTSFSRARV